MRFLVVLLIATVAVGAGFTALAATDNIPFVEEGGEGDSSGQDGVPTERTDRFDERAAFGFLERQVGLGPRPAGSAASRRLGEWLRERLPGGRFQAVPGGLRNVLGEVRGREPERYLVVGGHYDTKDLPGFVGANDGASGTAVVLELARTLEPGTLAPTVVFALFDGEESPAGTEESDFLAEGLRGSRVAAQALSGAEAMINVDLVGEIGLRLPREQNSDPVLWEQLRSAAARVGYAEVYPPGEQRGVLDDHIPFKEAGVPAIDLIDFDFECFHRTCDDLSAVSPASLDAAGEPLLELLETLGEASGPGL